MKRHLLASDGHIFISRNSAGKAFYRYPLTRWTGESESYAEFCLLSEVAECYQATFRQLIIDNKLIITKCETETDYFETISRVAK
mgnify:CR=1 FL=1